MEIKLTPDEQKQIDAVVEAKKKEIWNRKETAKVHAIVAQQKADFTAKYKQIFVDTELSPERDMAIKALRDKHPEVTDLDIKRIRVIYKDSEKLPLWSAELLGEKAALLFLFWERLNQPDKDRIKLDYIGGSEAFKEIYKMCVKTEQAKYKGK
jgi:hypothetical protein